MSYGEETGLGHSENKSTDESVLEGGDRLQIVLKLCI